jgi:hypothetical protein
VKRLASIAIQDRGGRMPVDRSALRARVLINIRRPIANYRRNNAVRGARQENGSTGETTSRANPEMRGNLAEQSSARPDSQPA